MLEFQVKWNEVSLTLENKIIKICQIFYALTDQIVRLGKTVLEAYILINTEPGIIWKVAEAALKIEGVKMAQAVTGQFDAVTYVEFKD